MKPINIKIMMALIEKEPGDQYVPVLKPVLMLGAAAGIATAK